AGLRAGDDDRTSTHFHMGSVQVSGDISRCAQDQLGRSVAWTLGAADAFWRRRESAPSVLGRGGLAAGQGIINEINRLAGHESRLASSSVVTCALNTDNVKYAILTTINSVVIVALFT